MKIEINVPDLSAKLGGMNAVFVTGTDTAVGKTAVACGLIRALAREKLRVAGMKPIAAGGTQGPAGMRNEDALALAAASNIPVPYDNINPYCLMAAVSPHIAAADEGVTIEIPIVQQSFEALTQLADFVVVEGAGGWLAPIGEKQTMEDVAIALSLPVLLVVGLRLGCLNHAMLSQRAIHSSGLRFAGWVANQIDPGFERLPENLGKLQMALGCEPLQVVTFVPS